MTSPFSDELLSAYLDGELNAEERAYVEAQLRERVELRRLCDELRALRATLQAMPVARPPENFAERVMRQAERQMLADAAPAADQPATVDAHSEETVELRRGSFLDSPKWRIGIGAVAAIAACVLAMVFLVHPALQPQQRVATVPPDAMNVPSESRADLTVDPRHGTTAEFSAKDNYELSVRGRTESLGFAEGMSAPKLGAPMSERESSLESKPDFATPAAPARHDEQPTGGPTSPRMLAAGETDSTARRKRFEDQPAAPAMAGSALGEAMNPATPDAGANSFDALGDRGTVAPSGYGAARGGLGGGMGGMSGEALPGAADMQLGKAIDTPADAMPPSQPAANMADDVKFRFSPGLEQAASDASDESKLHVLAQESNAWFGTPVTAETITQCTTQLDEARFLFVKISLPEGTKNEASSSISSYFSRGTTVPLELFAKQRLTEGNAPEHTPSPQEPAQNHDSFGSDAQLPQQVLVIDGSSEFIRQSIDQLVSLPESSVELATSDSAVTKQLADQQRILEISPQLAQQLEDRMPEQESSNGPQPDSSLDSGDKGMAKSDEKLDGEGEGKAAPTDASSDTGLAADKSGAANGSLLRRSARTTGEQATGEQPTMPAPAAQPQDPAPAVDRPAAPLTVRSKTHSIEEKASRGEMAGKPVAPPSEKDVATDRVVFYILYRLVPETAPPAPADEAGGR